MALRDALLHTKETQQLLLNKEENGETLSPAESVLLKQLKSRIARYRPEMRRARFERDQSSRDDRALLSSVLDAWKDLKTFRNEQSKFRHMHLSITFCSY